MQGEDLLFGEGARERGVQKGGWFSFTYPKISKVTGKGGMTNGVTNGEEESVKKRKAGDGSEWKANNGLLRQLEGAIRQTVREEIEKAVEKAVAPLKIEITQLRNTIYEYEKSRSGTQGQQRTSGTQDQTPYPTRQKAQATREATVNASATQSYSQTVKRGLLNPDPQNRWTTVQNKKKAKKTKLEQRRILFQLDKKPEETLSAQDLLLKVNQILRREKAEGISFI